MFNVYCLVAGASHVHKLTNEVRTESLELLSLLRQQSTSRARGRHAAVPRNQRTIRDCGHCLCILGAPPASARSATTVAPGPHADGSSSDAVSRRRADGGGCSSGNRDAKAAQRGAAAAAPGNGARGQRGRRWRSDQRRALAEAAVAATRTGWQRRGRGGRGRHTTSDPGSGTLAPLLHAAAAPGAAPAAAAAAAAADAAAAAAAAAAGTPAAAGAPQATLSVLTT